MTFFKGLSSNAIAIETGVERRRILRALLLVKNLIAQDIPKIFRGIAEVDETYLGGKWKNKGMSQRTGIAKRGRGTSKTPVFGIL